MLEEHLYSLCGALNFEGNRDVLSNPDSFERLLSRLLAKTIVKYRKKLSGVDYVVLRGCSNQFDFAVVCKNRGVWQEVSLLTQEHFREIKELICDSPYFGL